MQLLLVVALFCGFAMVENAPQSGDAELIGYKDERFDLDTGRYSYGFETSNGITRQENGVISEEGDLEVQGSYSFTSPEGKVYTVTYTAGKDGYRATVREDKTVGTPLVNRISGKLLESLGG